MELKKIPYELAVCKLKNVKDIDLNEGFYFVGCLSHYITIIHTLYKFQL